MKLPNVLVALVLLVGIVVVGCNQAETPHTNTTPPIKSRAVGADAGAAKAVAAAKVLSHDEGRALMKDACLSCHSEEMMVQQRLTHAQWTKVVTKMIGWGATLDASEATSLTTWLASTYGPDAGAYEPATLPVTAASAELAKLPDGPFAGGDPERGRAVYTDNCAGCHGSDARGKLGVVLIDRPLLYRASEVAETIRRGRGRMSPIDLKDAEIADVLAYLRRLKN